MTKPKKTDSKQGVKKGSSSNVKSAAGQDVKKKPVIEDEDLDMDLDDDMSMDYDKGFDFDDDDDDDF